jgi:sigma-B regulation protein RsbU (phosphoserine phosphatase)
MTIRENPSLMREVIEKMDYMVRVMDADQKVIYMNKIMREKFGQTLGHICFCLLGKEEKCENCVTRETRLTGKPVMKDVLIGDKYYNVFSSPVNTDDGGNYSIELFHDITEQKKMEDELIQHYEKLKADIEFAKHIQKRALPIDGVYADIMEISSIYSPSEDLGGDLFDVVKMNENETLIYIADVSGHGITSSLLTIFLRQMVRGRVREKVNLQEIVDLLLKSYHELGIDEEQYLTVLFCLYNKEKKEAAFLNAGHNCLPVMIKGDGEIKEIEVKGMPICTLIEQNDYKQVAVPAEAGDRIVLYTDGIPEACNAEKVPFEVNRVLDVLKNNINLAGKQLTKKVIEEVERYAQRPIADDMAIIVSKLI